jgi:integrase
MGRKKKLWSKTITNDAAGLRVRLYERVAGGLLHRDVRQGDDSRDRMSLGHRDRERAETEAKALVQRLVELRTAGQATALTLGQLELLFVKHRLPLLSKDRSRGIKGMLVLLLAHFGREFQVIDLSQHDVDAYVAARTSGRVKSKRHRVKGDGVRAGTIRNELHLLRAMTVWAQGHRANGRRLLEVDPFAGLVLPREKNMKRPIATDERYQALLAVADTADPRGRFRTILVLARQTGRRINAIVNLKTSDVLRSRDQMIAALGAAGMDLKHADVWPNGAIRWGAATDKLRFETLSPISKAARTELDRYLREHPRVGDVPLFSATEDPRHCVHKELARYWLKRAESLAELPKLDRGGFHTFRRLWASERRHLPAQDVAAAGGWRSIEVMQSSYQQADAVTIQSVVENAVRGHNADTPKPQAAEAQ